MYRSATLLFGLVALIASPAGAAELRDAFDDGRLDKKTWNICQAAYPRLVGFGRDGDEDQDARFLRMSIDEDRGYIDQCKKAAKAGLAEAESNSLTAAVDLLEPADDFASDLGVSMYAAPMPELAGPCEEGDNKDYQRSELRLKQKKHLHHFRDPHWYSMRFRFSGDIPPCGSGRWITAQWKYRYPKGWPHKDFHANPFLAQRFDNGVLHVTVQNGQCRCMVASAKGDPDLKVPPTTPFVAQELFVPPTLEKTDPLKCFLSSRPADAPEEQCKRVTITVLTVNGQSPPLLPDPKQDWVTMSYRVKGGHEGDGQIDIYANENFIARVVGLIGYPDVEPGLMKFKYGVYRDRLPGTADMDIDDLCISKEIGNCIEGFRTID
jgi:hypothetical protein